MIQLPADPLFIESTGMWNCIDRQTRIDRHRYIYIDIFAIYTYKTQILKAFEIAHDEHTLCNLKQQTPFFSADFKRT